jgi:hemerythrin-like domain-containing protein
MKNVYDWIVKEHRAFKHLLEELIATEPDNIKKRLRLLNKFIKNFMAHETAEEKTLFQALKHNRVAKQATLKALEWHQSIRHTVADLANTKPSDISWLSKVIDAKENIVEHMKAEEETVLDFLKKAVEKARIEQIGSAFRYVEERELGTEATSIK